MAGSFVGYLVDQFGIEKVKLWYVNSTEAHMVFGKTLRHLEREWLAWLEETVVDDAHRDHVLAKQDFPADTGVRMKFRLVEGDAVKIQVNRSGESVNEAVFARWATFLSIKSGGYNQAGDVKITQGSWNDVVFVNDNGTGRLYVNGFLALERKDALHSSMGVLGIGIEKGTVEVKEFAAFGF